MGSYTARPPTRPVDAESAADEAGDEGLGDLLSGRFSDVDVDSVAAVREERADE